MPKTRSKAAEKQQKRIVPKGIPFRKNDPTTGERDPRINRLGQLKPRSQRELEKLLDEIFDMQIEVNDPTGKRVKISQLAAMLLKLATAKDSRGAIHLLERRFGKVPQKVDVTSDGEAIGKIDEQIVDRAVSTLADAVRKTLSGESGK